MAGLNPYHEFAQALDAGKLLDVHLNGQKPLRFDQDLSFGSDDLKEAFFTTKLLVDHKYPGTIGFDAHPYRTEADPWDFVDRNMRTYKIMKEKVQQFNENKEIQDLLEGDSRRESQPARPDGEVQQGRGEEAQGHGVRSVQRWRRASCPTSGWINW